MRKNQLVSILEKVPDDAEIVLARWNPETGKNDYFTLTPALGVTAPNLFMLLPPYRHPNADKLQDEAYEQETQVHNVTREPRDY